MKLKGVEQYQGQALQVDNGITTREFFLLAMTSVYACVYLGYLLVIGVGVVDMEAERSPLFYLVATNEAHTSSGSSPCLQRQAGNF
jgi:hypothetical protein